MDASNVPPDVLKQYVPVRKTIESKAQRIIGLSRMLQTLQYCGEDTIPVSPEALAVWAKLMDDATCAIVEELDSFLMASDAEEALTDTE